MSSRRTQEESDALDKLIEEFNKEMDDGTPMLPEDDGSGMDVVMPPPRPGPKKPN